MPVYGLGEVQWYACVSRDTVARWLGMGLITAPRGAAKFSFYNLVETHVLRAFEAQSWSEVRGILLGIREQVDAQVLADQRLGDHLHKLAAASPRPGEFRMRVEAAMGQLEYEGGRAFRYFPSLWDGAARTLAVCASTCFGRPCIAGTRVPTDAVASRFRAGEPVDSLAEDFGTTRELIEDAVRFEMYSRRS